MLAAGRAARREDVALADARSAGCWPRTSPPAATSRRSPPRPWTAGRCAPPIRPARLTIVGESAAGPWLRRRRRPGRGGAHLHRRGRAGRRRRGGHPGGRRARGRRRRASPRSTARRNIRPAGGDFRAGERLLQRRRAARPLAAVAGRRGRARPSLAVRAPAARRPPLHRRGDRRAGRRARPVPDLRLRQRRPWPP